LSVMVLRTTINVVGGYDESPLFRRLCDWDLWIRIGLRFPVGRVNRAVGCATCMHIDSVGKTVSLSKEGLAEIKKVQKLPRGKIRLQDELG